MWEKDRGGNIPLSQRDQLQGIHLYSTKVMKTIFPFRGRMDQDILWTVQVCAWWNSPLLIAGAGRHSPAERSLMKKRRQKLYLNPLLDGERRLLQINVSSIPWLWGSKDSHAYLSRVWACSGRSFWGGGCKGNTTFVSLNYREQKKPTFHNVKLFAAVLEFYPCNN